MYASIRRGQANPGAAVEVAQRIKENFVPIISQVPGLVAYYVVNLGDDMLATISIFEDQAGAEDSARRAADWVKRDLAPLMASPLEIMVGEVVVHKIA